MIKYEPLQRAIQEFKLRDKPLYIVYECQYLRDLSVDIEYALHGYSWLSTGEKKPKPLIPENRKNILIYGCPGYMRELGFYGFVIYGYAWKMYNYPNEKRFFFTKC